MTNIDVRAKGAGWPNFGHPFTRGKQLDSPGIQLRPLSRVSPGSSPPGTALWAVLCGGGLRAPESEGRRAGIMEHSGPRGTGMAIPLFPALRDPGLG